MSLLAIKRHMRQVKMATLNHLCLIFNAEPDTMRCLISHWMQKGNIRQCTKKPACGTKCFKCPSAATELYEWIDFPQNQQVDALTFF